MSSANANKEGDPEDSGTPTVSSDISAENLSRLNEATSVVTSEHESGSCSSAIPTLGTTVGHDVPLVTMSGGKSIFLSDQFTAVLIKPESLLYGLEVPLIKKEPGEVSGTDIITVPTASALPGDTVSIAQIPWLVPLTQEAQQKHGQAMQHIKSDGRTGGPTLIVPTVTSPDAASATPSAPYMFESKDRSFSCEFCPNIRFTRGQLRRHKTVHLGQRNYVCNVCGKRFAWKHSLLKHTVLHTGQSPFSCPQCGKGFSAAHHLHHHIKMHDSERQFQCTICEKSFARPDELIVHARTHTGQETFPCEVCDKSFTTKFGLNTHMRSHGETTGLQFTCGVCGIKFAFNSDRIKHSKLHGQQAGLSLSGAEGQDLIVSGKDIGTQKQDLTHSAMDFVTDSAHTHSQPDMDSKRVPVVMVHGVEIQQTVPNIPMTPVTSCPSS